MLKSKEANDILAAKGRALSVWFSTDQLLDLGTVVLAAMDNIAFQRFLKRFYNLDRDQLTDLALKLEKEVKRV